MQDIKEDLGEYDWSALYGGNPLSEKGNLFKREYFWYFDVQDDLFVLHKPNGDVAIPVLHLFPDLGSYWFIEKVGRLWALGTCYLTPTLDLLLDDVMRERRLSQNK